MTQEQLVSKAIETADLIAGNGLLNDEQSEKFITYLRDMSVMTKDARVIPMKARKREINRLGIGQRVSVPAFEGVDPAVRKKVETAKSTLDTAEIMTPFEITYDTFEDNIEGENLEDTIIKLFASRIATDHEELYINGDKDSEDTFLALQEGWAKLAKANGYTYNHAGKGVYTLLFAGMLDLLPEEFTRSWDDLRFYVSPKVEHAWRRFLSSRPTPVGDKALLESMPTMYAGIPVIRVPMIPSNLEVAIEGSDKTDVSFALLTLRQNLVVGVHRELMLEKDKNIFARVRRYAFTSRVACTLEEPKAAVIGINVSLSGSTT